MHSGVLRQAQRHAEKSRLRLPRRNADSPYPGRRGAARIRKSLASVAACDFSRCLWEHIRNIANQVKISDVKLADIAAELKQYVDTSRNVEILSSKENRNFLDVTKLMWSSFLAMTGDTSKGPNDKKTGPTNNCLVRKVRTGRMRRKKHHLLPRVPAAKPSLKMMVVQMLPRHGRNYERRSPRCESL